MMSEDAEEKSLSTAFYKGVSGVFATHAAKDLERLNTALFDGLQKAFCALIERAARDIEWDTVEEISAPAFEYASGLAGMLGPDAYVLEADGGELKIGISIWDEETCEDLIVSEPIALSTILTEPLKIKDVATVKNLIEALEKTVEIAKATIEANKENS